MVVTLPLRLVNASNAREHWAKRAKRDRQERQIAHGNMVYVRRLLLLGPADHVLVTLHRGYPARGKPFDAHDGLPRAFKSIADGVTAGLGFKDDADPRLIWQYSQGREATYCVRITVEILKEGT